MGLVFLEKLLKSLEAMLRSRQGGSRLRVAFIDQYVVTRRSHSGVRLITMSMQIGSFEAALFIYYLTWAVCTTLTRMNPLLT